MGGRDPPDALATLLDSLRNVAALAVNPTLGTDGGGDVDGSVGGSGVGGGNPGGEKGRELVGRVMRSLSLWARRLKKRSDDRHEARASRLQQAGEGSSAGAPTSRARAASARAPAAAASAASASAAAAPAAAVAASSAASPATTAVADTECEGEKEGAEEEGAVLPWTTSSTLYGECLEAAAIKALAAPRDPLPLRFFAVLAAAAAAAAADADTVVVPQMASPGPTRAGTENELVRIPEALDTGKCASAASTSIREELLAAEPGAETKDKAAAAAGSGSAAGGEGEAGRGEHQRGSALAGVLEIVRRRMNGQLRLSEKLLGDEVN